MELSEFLAVTSRAERYYEKEYSKDQISIMFEELSSISIELYKKAIKNCINTCKYLPKIADIKQFIAESRPDYRNNTNDNNIEYIKCPKCSKGFIRYQKLIGEYNYDYMCLCTCKNGDIQRQQGYSFLPNYTDVGITPVNGIAVDKNSKDYRNEISVTYSKNFVRSVK